MFREWKVCPNGKIDVAVDYVVVAMFFLSMQLQCGIKFVKSQTQRLI